jgi:N-acetylornithine carbamoyltransferase
MRKFAEYSEVPVLNMCSDLHHPTQALADIMIMKEKLGDVRGKKIVLMWAYSPLLRRPQAQQRDADISAIYGMNITIVCPEGYDLDPTITSFARKECANNGRKLEETHDLKGALEGADIVFPRIWASPNFYTNPREEELRLAAQHKDWRLTDALLRLTNNAWFINSMPFDRGNEVDDSVADGPNSAIYDQAEDLLHVRKAILALTMADSSSLESIWNY